MSESKTDVFIIHAKEDEGLAKVLKEFLHKYIGIENERIFVFNSPESIRSSAVFMQTILEKNRDRRY